MDLTTTDTRATGLTDEIETLILESQRLISESISQLNDASDVINRLAIASTTTAIIKNNDVSETASSLPYEMLSEFLQLQERFLAETCNIQQAKSLKDETLKLERKIESLNLRLCHYKSNIPQHWEAEHFSVIEKHSSKGISILEWNFQNLYLNDFFFTEMVVLTELRSKNLKLIIKRPVPNNTKSNGSLRWPELLTGISDLEFSTLDEPKIFREKCAALSTSGFTAIITLVRKLTHYVKSPYSNAPKIFKNANLTNSLAQLAEQFKSIPSYLRYDSSAIESIEQNGYAALNITLRNANLDSRTWPELKFAFSSVDHSPGIFGNNPRLEFEIFEGCPVGQNGKITTDERGSRFELRFAHPNIIDIPTLNSTSAADQLLLISLVVALPDIINAYTFDHTFKRIPKLAWVNLANIIKSCLAFNTTRQVSRSK